MSDEKEKPKDLFPEREAQMKTLFQKLTEIILGSARTRKDGADLLVAVSNWAALMIATIIVVLEGNKGRAMHMVDRVTGAMNAEIKRHVVMISGLQNKAKGKEESRIITRDNPNPGG